jgi:hypothetical protein
MNQPTSFMDQPFTIAVQDLFRNCGANFDLSLEDRRRCGLALEGYFAARAGNQAPHSWFMPIIFGGVKFLQTPPWAVMLAMGIYGYLAEGSPTPSIYQPKTLSLGYHAIRIPASEPFYLARDGAKLKLTDAFLRIDHKVDPRIWIDFYGIAPLRPGVRVVPFTLIPGEDLSGCIAGAILVDAEREVFLNPLKPAFGPSDLELFFIEEPRPNRLRAHRERLYDILRCPVEVLEANLDVGIDLIRNAFCFPV